MLAACEKTCMYVSGIYVCMHVHLMEDGLYVLIARTDKQVEMVFENFQAFFESFKKLKLDSKLERWEEKELQGRIARAGNVHTPPVVIASDQSPS